MAFNLIFHRYHNYLIFFLEGGYVILSSDDASTLFSCLSIDWSNSLNWLIELVWQVFFFLSLSLCLSFTFLPDPSRFVVTFVSCCCNYIVLIIYFPPPRPSPPPAITPSHTASHSQPGGIARRFVFCFATSYCWLNELQWWGKTGREKQNNHSHCIINIYNLVRYCVFVVYFSLMGFGSPLLSISWFLFFHLKLFFLFFIWDAFPSLDILRQLLIAMVWLLSTFDWFIFPHCGALAVDPIAPLVPACYRRNTWQDSGKAAGILGIRRHPIDARHLGSVFRWWKRIHPSYFCPRICVCVFFLSISSSAAAAAVVVVVVLRQQGGTLFC